MAISATGRIVKVKSKTELKRVGGRRMRQEALEYNHLRVYFSDGSDRHFLFTDKQIEIAIKSGHAKIKKNLKVTWVKEVWYEGVMELSAEDIANAIEKFGLPKQAKSYNHVRIDVNGKEVHLVFSHSTIRNAIRRAKKKGGRLPKVSWLSDRFFHEENEDGKERQSTSESQRQSDQSQETASLCTQESVD